MRNFLALAASLLFALAPTLAFALGEQGTLYQGQGYSLPTIWTQTPQLGYSGSAGTLQLYGATSGSSVLNAPATSGGAVTFFTGADTVVGRATTDTLTNKTIAGGSNTITGITPAMFGNIAAWTILSNNTGSSAAPTAVPYPTFAEPTTYRNLLDNGAFNVYQRGVAAVTSVNTTATYHADRWAGYANTGAASVTLTNITASLPVGFGNAEQVQRANSNASVQPVFLVQEIPSVDVVGAQGQTVCISLSAIAGANFSAASSNLTVQLITGTGVDQGLSSLLAATWSGQATTLTVNQAITTSWVRYAPAGFCVTMPSTATEAAVQVGFTPVGTAGANDWFQVTGVQIEEAPSAGPYEQRQQASEIIRDQRFFYQLTEANAFLPGTGACTATNTLTFPLALPVQMRTAPTAALTVGGFQAVINGAAAAGITGTGVGTSTVASVVITATNTCTAGFTAVLRGSGTTGKLTATADF